VLIAAAGAANVLRIDLSKADLAAVGTDDPFASLAEAVGRLADAGEKIDHLEEFVTQSKEAILDLVRWSVAVGRAADVAIASHAAEAMRVRWTAHLVRSRSCPSNGA